MKKTISIFLTALLCCAMAFSVTFTASAKFNQEAIRNDTPVEF